MTKFLALFCFFAKTLICEAKRGGGSGGGSSAGSFSNEASLADQIAFTPTELFFGLGILVAAFCTYVIVRNISRIPKQTKMPIDFRHLKDPIERQQEVRYILTQSKRILEDRKKEHQKIICRIWGGKKNLLDKSYLQRAFSGEIDE